MSVLDLLHKKWNAEDNEDHWFLTHPRRKKKWIRAYNIKCKQYERAQKNLLRTEMRRLTADFETKTMKVMKHP